jgi:hypothetical protein
MSAREDWADYDYEDGPPAIRWRDVFSALLPGWWRKR